MKKIKHKGFLIALVSALIISSSFIACDMKSNKSNVENEKANLENNIQKETSLGPDLHLQRTNPVLWWFPGRKRAWIR